MMLLTAISEAVERYDPSREAAILLEVASGYQVLILSPGGYDYVGGLTFEGYGLLVRGFQVLILGPHGWDTSAFSWVSGASREAAVGLPEIMADEDGAANRFTSVTPWVAQQRPIVAEASHVSRRKVNCRNRDRRKLRNISDGDYAPPASLRAYRLLAFGSSRRIRGV
jgi:hypothetical protein